ncbi:hypothetical protein Pmani_034744 [Petrolisthes manimaculis]|uniref:Uncharacterized protein n=1 Tax=Petrolisthes manimaculis TaxID=1843537 RepID=A0AAE1NNR6_9EUCA|nr:hypothetical protein Pmani_034744 [Petrolisthes manimaculis]
MTPPGTLGRECVVFRPTDKSIKNPPKYTCYEGGHLEEERNPLVPTSSSLTCRSVPGCRMNPVPPVISQVGHEEEEEEEEGEEKMEEVVEEEVVMEERRQKGVGCIGSG